MSSFNQSYPHPGPAEAHEHFGQKVSLNKGEIFQCPAALGCRTTNSIGGASPSPQHKALHDPVLKGDSHVLIELGFGVDGTEIAFEVAQSLPPKLRVGMFMPDSEVACKTTAMLRQNGFANIWPQSYEEYAFNAIKQCVPGLRCRDSKLRDLMLIRRVDRKLQRPLCRVVHLCMNNLCDGSDQEELVELVDRHSIYVLPQKRAAIFDLAPQILQECAEDRMCVGQDEVVWQTLHRDMPLRTFDVVIIVRPEDANWAQLLLALRASGEGRVIVVGDQDRGVYGPHGSNADAIGVLRILLSSKERGCQTLQLAVPTGCPRLHLRLLRNIAPDLKTPDGGPEGEIIQVSEKKAVETIEPGDLVISREHNPLVEMVCRLRERGIKAALYGSEFYRDLRNVVDTIGANSSGGVGRSNVERERRTPADLLNEAIDHLKQEKMRLLALRGWGAIGIVQRVDVLKCVLKISDGLDAIDGLRSRVDELFADQDDYEPADTVLLGTIWHTRRLKRPTVYVLGPHLIPHPTAQREWQLEHERNLACIAATRATSKPGDQGGRLIFVGAIPDIYGADAELLEAVKKSSRNWVRSSGEGTNASLDEEHA